MALKIRTDYSAAALRLLAKGAEDVDQSRRLLSLAAAVEGTRIGGMDRQTLRDWVHRFNEQGPEGLRNVRHDGPAPRLSRDQQAELAALVEAGPDPVADGVVRWRRVDLQRLIADRFGIHYHERSVGKILKKLGFSHVSARPRHPGQDAAVMEAFKKTSRAR